MNFEEQLRAIVDKLVGAPDVPLPPVAALEEPWRSIFLAVRRAGDRTEAERILWDAVESHRDAELLYDRIVPFFPDDAVFAAYPSVYEKRRAFTDIDWLWPSWIPRGVVTLFGAAPGAGKSLVALDLARRIVHGLPMPDGTAMPDPERRWQSEASRKVLVIDAEGAPGILYRRAEAWGLDTHRLFLMEPPRSGDVIDLDSPDQQEIVKQMCWNLQPALVVVDSLAACATHSESSLEGAQALLSFLSSVAARFETALLVIHHLRKRARSGALAAVRPAADDLRGSSHLSAAARSVLALSLGTTPGGDLDFNGPRRLEVVKTNLCRYPRPLCLALEGEGTVAPTLHYEPWVDPPQPVTQIELCAQWLLDFLSEAGQPVKPRDVVAAARDDGFSRRTVYRARHFLAAAIVDVGSGLRDSGKLWSLPPDPRAKDTEQ